MALSGSFSTNKYTTSSHGTIGLTLSWTATQSIVNNTSTVTWTLKSSGTMSSGYYVQAGPVTVRIAGTTVLNTTSRFNMYGGGGYKRTGTITLSHTQEGARNMAMSVRAAIYSSSVNCTASKTFALDNIDRYALLTSIEDFTDEGNPTITYINPLGTDLVTDLKVRLTWNSGANYTSWVALNDAGGTYTFNLSAQDRTDLLSGCPNSNTLPIQYDLQSTMGGVDYHDYKNATMSVINADPTAGAVTYQDSDAAIVAITGNNQIIVQNQSTLKIITSNSTANKGASIADYILNFNGVNTNITADKYLEIVTPNYSGTFVATVTTVDTRGNYVTATASITITPWSAPTAECTLERQNGFETNTDLFVDGTISTVTGSTMTITERHKETGGSWSAAATIPDNTTTVLSLLNTTEWDVEVAVSDAFATTTYTLSVAKGIPIMFIDEDMSSVSIHGFPDAANQLYVDGTIKLNGMELPHSYSTSEQKIGKWIDGTDLYEKTIELNSTVTLSANGNTNIMSWSGGSISIIYFNGLRISGGITTSLSFIGGYYNNGYIVGVNPRASTQGIDVLTIRYTKN